MWSLLLGIIVLGGLLALVLWAKRGVDKGIDNPRARPVGRDVVDRQEDRSS